jgi:hypothetical protein
VPQGVGVQVPPLAFNSSPFRIELPASDFTGTSLRDERIAQLFRRRIGGGMMEFRAHRKRFSTLAMVALVVAGSTATQALQPDAPSGESFVRRAVFVAGRVWILSGSGHLSSIAANEVAPRQETLPDPAYDLCSQQQRPLVVTCPREQCRTWMLRQWSSGKWSVRANVPTEGDELVAVSCDDDRTSLVTTRRLIDITSEGQSSTGLSGQLRLGLISVTYDTPYQLYVGFDRGEWGGGLFRIIRSNGAVLEIQQNDGKDLCGGPLNTGCDPVNAIVSEPAKPDCVVAAIGLEHFVSHGRLVRVCGDRVEPFYNETYKTPLNGRAIVATVPFYGLVRQGDILWAISDKKIYRFESGRLASSISLPSFKNIGGIDISFDLPQFVVLYTEINAELAVSGSVPMLIPR